jgi:hypothetical protein
MPQDLLDHIWVSYAGNDLPVGAPHYRRISYTAQSGRQRHASITDPRTAQRVIEYPLFPDSSACPGSSASADFFGTSNIRNWLWVIYYSLYTQQGVQADSIALVELQPKSV